MASLVLTASRRDRLAARSTHALTALCRYGASAALPQPSLFAAKAADPRPRGTDGRPAESLPAVSLQLPQIVQPGNAHLSPTKRAARSGQPDEGREGRRTPERLPLIGAAHAPASEVADSHSLAEVCAPYSVFGRAGGGGPSRG